MLRILAWRNIWRNRRRTLIAISSVFFAVLLAIVFISFEQGTYEHMIHSMVRLSTGYIRIQDVMYQDEPSMDNAMLVTDELYNILDKFAPRIDLVVPRLENFALVATATQTQVAYVSGIDPEKEDLLNQLAAKVVQGRYLHADDRGILISSGLAGKMKVSPGDTLVLLGQGFQGSMAAGRYPVLGIVDLKIPELNNRMIYLPLEEARWFYGAEDRLTALIIMPRNPSDTRKLADAIGALLDKEWYSVYTWQELLKDLLTLMQFDQAGTRLMTLILYIVITFGLFGTILTMMIERQREFALLISIGMSRLKLAGVTLLETLMISFTGALSGMLVAVPIVLWFRYHPMQFTGNMAQTLIDYGFEPIMIFSADPSVFYQQALIVLILSLLMGFYPVYRIFRLDIVKVKQL